MLAFKETTVRFDPTKGIVQSEPGFVSFGSQDIISANAVIKGFYLGFTDSDHHLFKEEISIRNVKVANGGTVSFNVTLSLRDSSGKFDDRYEGWVNVLVIAEIRELGV